jgi:hypothetical protein
MSLSKHGDGYEIIRFFNILGHRVIGGAGKLLSHFLKHFKPASVLTYADRRFSNGTLYKTLGFKLLGITRPNYVYISPDGEILSRQRCQKHKLHHLLTVFCQDKTETENMFAAGYRRLWDAGHYRFVLNISTPKILPCLS